MTSVGPGYTILSCSGARAGAVVGRAGATPVRELAHPTAHSVTIPPSHRTGAQASIDPFDASICRPVGDVRAHLADNPVRRHGEPEAHPNLPRKLPRRRASAVRPEAVFRRRRVPVRAHRHGVRACDLTGRRAATSLGDLGLMTAAAGAGWSRVNDNKHLLSDVVAGTALGVTAAQLVERRWTVFGWRISVGRADR